MGLKKLTFFLFMLLFTISVFAASDLVIINLSRTEAWWGDLIRASGTANYSDGSPINGSDVQMLLNGELYCSNVTDQDGSWECFFSAPLELGNYDILVNITNSTGSSFTNTSALEVKLSYGEVPIGVAERVVYKRPILLQEPSGRIRRVWVRIMVWRG